MAALVHIANELCEEFSLFCLPSSSKLSMKGRCNNIRSVQYDKHIRPMYTRVSVKDTPN